MYKHKKEETLKEGTIVVVEGVVKHINTNGTIVVKFNNGCVAYDLKLIDVGIVVESPSKKRKKRT